MLRPLFLFSMIQFLVLANYLPLPPPTSAEMAMDEMILEEMSKDNLLQTDPTKYYQVKKYPRIEKTLKFRCLVDSLESEITRFF